MSDMATELYTAWEIVTSSVESRLFCSWHVRKNWEENLGKIKNKDKQKPTFQFLKTVADELYEDKFTILLEDLMKLFEKDPDLRDYKTYFSQHYYSNSKRLAACSRQNAQINTNMSLEHRPMHKTIKYCYFSGKKMNPLFFDFPLR